MSYKDFANDYKKGITGDTLFFYGAEDYLMNWAKGQVINDNVPEDSRDLDVINLDGETVSAYDIMGEARAYSMFSDRRVVIVNNYLPLFRKVADVGTDELKEFVKSPLDSTILIFVLDASRSSEISAFGKQMIKACSSYEFARLERADLKAFINKRVHAASKMIARRELEHLIDVTGYYNRDSAYDLAELDKDISKLVKASAEDEISADLIEDMLTGDSDKFVFNLVDALTSGDRGRALAIAEAIIRDQDGAMAVLALLTKQFEIMYDALELSKEGLSIAQMAKKTGANEFRFKRAYNAANKYSLTKIKTILKDLYNADRDIKRGDIDKDTALELFALSACPGR
ncbi:MAG: DNA polymerase III subunit delta [Mogibacterium sp.]|nr:DNA polymerase III subunit delta [Mogibacterium sp.]